MRGYFGIGIVNGKFDVGATSPRIQERIECSGSRNCRITDCQHFKPHEYGKDKGCDNLCFGGSHCGKAILDESGFSSGVGL